MSKGNYTEYPFGSGQLKNYGDGVWYVLDDFALIQYELDKKDYKSDLQNGKKVKYNICIDNDNTSNRWANIITYEY